MSKQQWLEAASGLMSEDERDAVQQARAAMPAGFDGKAQMAKFQDLNARIKAALPLDPASEQAQRFLEQRDTMLAPFLAAMPPEMKEMSKNLRGKIEQGDLPPPIDAEVDRFYRDATRARREMGQA
jgi:hypothetical protein